MGGGGGDQETTTEVKLPWYLQYGQQHALNMAGQAAGQTPTTPFSGQFNALPTEQEYGDVNRLRELYLGQQGQGNQVINYASDVLAGKYLDPNQNQAFKDYVNLSVYDPLYERLTSQVLPSIRSEAIAQGAYGGSRNAVAESSAYRDTASEAANQAARSALTLYEGERQNMNVAPYLAQLGSQMNLQPTQGLVDLSAYERGLDQIPLNEALAQFNEQIAAPWRAVTPYTDIVRAIQGGAPATTVTNVEGGGGSQAGGAVQGALGGAAAGAAAGSVIPGLGTTLGALLGGVLGGAGGFFG